MKRWLLLTLLLACLRPALGLGMFDLPPGTWIGELDSQALSITVGEPADRAMIWTYGETRALGTYKVTATKGEPHVTFSVTRVEGAADLDVQGLRLAPGVEARLILSYDGDKMTVDAFDPDIVPVFRVELKEAR